MVRFSELEPSFRNKTVEKEIVICRRCKGEGMIHRFNYYGNTDGYIPETVSCPECGSKGRLLRTVTTEYALLD
jgi:ssDNA-binding Zn-finger/Zn-ribbon topoisomerase 1